MNASNTGPTATPAFLGEQLIVDLFQLKVFHAQRSGMLSPDMGWKEEAGWHDVVFIARRLPEWRTNVAAARGVRDVLDNLNLLPPRGATGPMTTLSRLGERDEEPRRHLALQAHGFTPGGGIADALVEYLPFTVDCQPARLSEHWLDEAQTIQFSGTTQLLMLAWLIYARTV